MDRMTRWAIGLIAMLAVACAASPQDRLLEVSGALTEARRQGVDRWAPMIVAEAASLLEAAEEEIDQQNARRFSVRSFRVARLLLDDAGRRLEAARAAARSATVDARAQADEKLRTASAAVAQVRALRQTFPLRPDTADDRAGIDADLDTLELELEGARHRFGDGAFLEAADAADRVAARGQRMADLVSRSLAHHALPSARATI